MDQQEQRERLEAGHFGEKRCPACGLALDPTVLTCPHDGTSLITPIEQEPEFKEKYEFLGTIGVGGMGVIYKARQTAINKLVAIKMLHPHMVSTEAFRRFQIEGTAVSRLQHPYIISVHDLAMTESGQPYMVMDFVEGRTLAQVIERDGALEKNRCLRMFDQICDALAHAHSRGVLHRDLKPSNIMLLRRAGQEEVRIMDFGIAKLIDAAEQNNSNQLTRTGETIGSPQYMSPEQARGGKTDVRSDIYSLGCVLYEALTGAPPFSAATPLEIMMLHLNETPFSLRQSVLGKIEFPDDLETIIARLLEKNPDLRYQSMEELQAALQRVQAGRKLDKFTAERRLNWQAIGIGALIGAVVTAALGVVAFNFLKKSAPAPPVSLPNSLLLPTPKDNEQGRDTNQSLIKNTVAQSQRSIDLSNMDSIEDITDDDIASLKDATNVTEINLNKAGIDDGGLKHISGLKLEKLSLNRTHVKDLVPLKDMNTLKDLDLERSTVTGKGLSSIAHLSNLSTLNLTGTGVSDEDLHYLIALHNLKDLKIQNCTHITMNALAHLQSKMLTCHFEPSLTFYPTNSNMLLVPKSVEQANEKRWQGKSADAARGYVDAIKEMKEKAVHPDPGQKEPERLNRGLVARCLKSRAECLGALGKNTGKRNPKLAEDDFRAADVCFKNAEDTLEKTGFTGWDGETAKRLELCDMYVEHAQSLEFINDWSQAVVLRDKANTLCVAPSDPKMIRNLVDLATDLQRENRPERCEVLLKEAMRRYQTIGKTDSLDYAHSAQRLGDVYGLQHRFKEALVPYELAVSIMKKNPEIWSSVSYDDLRMTTAVTYIRLARDAEAEPLLKQVLTYEPKRKEAIVMLVSVLTKEHKSAEAAHYADQVKAM